MSFLDIAVSPVDSLLAVKSIDQYEVSLIEKRKLKDLRKEVKEMEEVDEASAQTLASLEKSVGSKSSAERNLLTAIEKNPNSCGNYLELGKVYMDLENFAQSEENLQKASKMYHAWWDRSLDERLSIQKPSEMMENVESDEERKIKAGGWTYDQPDSCREARCSLTCRRLL